MFYYALTGLINAIASTALGFFVFSINRKNPLNRAFAFFCFAVAFWSWAYCFWPLSRTKSDMLFWFQVLHIGAIIIPAAYSHFVFIFLGLEKKNRILIFFNYLISAFFVSVVFTPLFIADMVPKFSFPYWANPGIFYHFFLIYFFATTVYCWILLYRAKDRYSGERRLQIMYVLIGTLIGFLGGSTNYFLWYGIPIPPYGNGLVVFYIILSAVAVIRYHLFEARLIFTEIMVGVMGVMFLVLPFLMPDFELKAITAVALVLFCIFGYFLIKAAHRESRRRHEAELAAEQEAKLRRDAEKLAADLKRLDAAKTQFLLSTQHHLRSPLTVIQGYLSMIGEGGYGKIPAKAKEKIDASLNSTKKLIRLVNDLLDVAHFQMNKGISPMIAADTVAIISEVVDELNKSALEKNIYLRFEKSAQAPPLINLDVHGIREALYNILDNAIKYTSKGGVTVAVDSLADRLQILISDTGIGIDLKDISGLLERTFERGENARSVNSDGRGIGLYLAGQMIKNNGGIIKVDSAGLGKGTQFIIELPFNIKPAA